MAMKESGQTNSAPALRPHRGGRKGATRAVAVGNTGRNILGHAAGERCAGQLLKKRNHYPVGPGNLPTRGEVRGLTKS